MPASHPIWVRGLKLGYCYLYLGLFLSHPIWVRGLKPIYKDRGNRVTRGRTLCGCVD